MQTGASRAVGRYRLFERIASGGMASVHLGRLVGAAGFTRTVAIKRMHEHLSSDPDFIAMFTQEARLASRIRHPNVVATLDVVVEHGDLFLVMDYVHGESLSGIVRASTAKSERIPPALAVTLVVGVLHGLHAAHEATSDDGLPLAIVHRDVSPQNILVGVDGVPRVLDFGIAKASATAVSTRDGHVKGKAAYMAPEQLDDRAKVDRRTDVYAAGIVLWELLTGRRLFQGDSPAAVVTAVLSADIPSPRALCTDVPPELERIVLRALERDPQARFSTAREMAIALEELGLHRSASQVGAWVERLAEETLARRSALLGAIEATAPSSTASDDATDVGPAVEPVGDIPVHVATTQGRDRATRRRSSALSVAFATGSIVVITSALAIRGARDGHASGQGDSTTRDALAPAAEAPSIAPTPATTASQAVGPTEPTSSAVVATTPTARPASAPSSPRKLEPPRTERRPASSISARPGCDPNFYIEPSGVKHFKPECL